MLRSIEHVAEQHSKAATAATATATAAFAEPSTTDRSIGNHPKLGTNTAETARPNH